jgi:hypothetical protein
MKLTALITTLVLGSSSVAMARPASPTVVRDHRTPVQQPAPIYQPAPQPAPIYQPAPDYHRPHHRSWITLGGIDHKVDGAMSFGVRWGQQFSTLKLKSEAGKSLINRVVIQFANGRTQVVELNQYLNRSNPTITIDLDGRARAIAKVTVVGRNARSSAYRVLAI